MLDMLERTVDVRRGVGVEAILKKELAWCCDVPPETIKIGILVFMYI